MIAHDLHGFFLQAMMKQMSNSQNFENRFKLKKGVTSRSDHGKVFENHEFENVREQNSSEYKLSALSKMRSSKERIYFCKKWLKQC